MSKRRPASASKHARSPKIAARAQRTKQTIVRSPKDNPPRTVAAGSIEPPELHNNPIQEALVENSSTALQDDLVQVVRDNDSEKGFDSPSATANVQAYQARIPDVQVYQATILEMAQANMQFASEFAQRLAAIRSPLEIFGVMAEFTSKRIAMFGKYSRQMYELTTRR